MYMRIFFFFSLYVTNSTYWKDCYNDVIATHWFFISMLLPPSFLLCYTLAGSRTACGKQRLLTPDNSYQILHVLLSKNRRYVTRYRDAPAFWGCTNLLHLPQHILWGLERHPTTGGSKSHRHSSCNKQCHGTTPCSLRLWDGLWVAG